MMVSSRIFGITVNNIKTDGFVPYADMLNHKRPR
jgi:histone-lysine N-methyltransferase SETD3